MKELGRHFTSEPEFFGNMFTIEVLLRNGSIYAMATDDIEDLDIFKHVTNKLYVLPHEIKEIIITVN